METIARARGEAPAAKVVGLDRQRGQPASATSAAVTVGAGAGGSAASAENEALNPKTWRPTVRIVGAGR
jgi:hypothetical protein